MKKRRACDRCRSLRKRCDCRDGVFPCTRCVNNGAECTHSGSPPPTRARSPVTTPPQQFFFGEYMDKLMLDTMATWPPTHAGLKVTLRYLAGLAKTVNAPDKLARIFEIATKAGEDMNVMIATAEAATAGVVIDTTVAWEDIPFRQQHLQTLPRSDMPPQERLSYVTHFTSNCIKLWVPKAFSDWLYDGPTELINQWKMCLARPIFFLAQKCEPNSYINICKAFVHLINATSEYKRMQSVRISDLRFNDGTIVDCIVSVVYISDTEGVCFIDFFKPAPSTPEVIPPSESKNVEVDPLALDSQWQFCEEDIAILQSVLEE
jgi:hypothetical protein